MQNHFCKINSSFVVRISCIAYKVTKNVMGLHDPNSMCIVKMILPRISFSPSQLFERLRSLLGRKTDARQDHFPMHISLGSCNPSMHTSKSKQCIPPSKKEPKKASKSKIFIFCIKDCYPFPDSMASGKLSQPSRLVFIGQWVAQLNQKSQ